MRTGIQDVVRIRTRGALRALSTCGSVHCWRQSVERKGHCQSWTVCRTVIEAEREGGWCAVREAKRERKRSASVVCFGSMERHEFDCLIYSFQDKAMSWRRGEPGATPWPQRGKTLPWRSQKKDTEHKSTRQTVLTGVHNSGEQGRRRNRSTPFFLATEHGEGKERKQCTGLCPHPLFSPITNKVKEKSASATIVERRHAALPRKITSHSDSW